ncbi:MAG: 2-oxoacid:ferredoxin oxidoreductase subunit beta [Beggiatoa sp. IS2]|nr:MAG: 2-oxoacid:ferredoxin oxidoreductase subunit beta [Beggiatoa sp. IS2]
MSTALDEVILSPHSSILEYTAKDFKPDTDVRWCAGCGGYSILAQVQKTMPTLGVPKENIVFISGIGCSSRFPYYMDVFGMHATHGRALPIATGLKIARPDLSVWVSTGDGDCMSIGGNHFIHAARRNINLNVLMFNNEIYGLTKGQYSPTSRLGQVTKSSPLGVLDNPFNPAALALGAGASFVARGVDSDPHLMRHLLERAAQHKGFSFVEIYTNCVIFNDGAFEDFRGKETRKEKTVVLEHGKPLVFGEHNDKGIRLDGFKPVVVSLNNGYSINDLLVHDETDSTLSFILANMTYAPDLPRPLGIFQALQSVAYEEKMTHLLEKEYAKAGGEGDLDKLLRGEDSWVIQG